MEFFRAALYNCIVNDDELDFEAIDHYRHMVEVMNTVDTAAPDDVKKLMMIAFKWLDDSIHKPFHVYMLWQACRALLMNGFSTVTDRQVTAIFKEHPREFAKCFSDDEDIDDLMVNMNGPNDDPELWNMYIVKVRKLGNKLLKSAEEMHNPIEFSHAKYNPDYVPYGLTELISSRKDGTAVDPQDDYEANYEEMMFKYDVAVDTNGKHDKEMQRLPSVWDATELSMKLNVEFTVKYNNGELHKSVVKDFVSGNDFRRFHMDASRTLGYIINTNM